MTKKAKIGKNGAVKASGSQKLCESKIKKCEFKLLKL